MLPSPPQNTGFQHRRIHSPDMWAHYPSSSPTIPSTRPSLGSLDLASPPSKSALPLTPPLTPASIRPVQSEAPSSRSNSIDLDSSYAHSPYLQWTPLESDHFNSHSSVLPSPTSPTHPQGSPSVRPQDLPDTQPATRFLFVSGIPKSATSQTLKQAFVGCGDLKGIFVRFQAEHGAIILAFHDLRHSIRAHRQIATRLFFDNVRLAPRFISADDLRQLIGQSNFVNSNDGDAFISTSFAGPEGQLDTTALQNVLASFGALRSFGVMDTHAKAFHVEYFDARDASSALNALSGRVILGVRLHLALRDPEGTGTDEHFESPLPSPIAPPAPQNIIPFPQSVVPFPHKDSPPAHEHRLPLPTRPTPTLQHSTSAQDIRRARTPSLGPTPPAVHVRRISNVYHFDMVGKMALPSTPPRPRSISVSSDTASPVAGRLALPPSPMAVRLPLPGGSWTQEEEEEGERRRARTVSVAPPYAPQQYFMGPVVQQAQPQVQAQAQPPALQLQMPGARFRQRGGLGLGLDLEGAPAAEGSQSQDRNKIDIAKIERGDDTRTTVMIKNIPNKMSDRHLVDFINDVCPRKIDFLYLRMDFTNGCNVGYAFVNFIRVEDLLHFAKIKLGTKWNLFSSEKILGMSYANYQGKEALIDKFRSSSIMDQREAWRPKLFYSSGPKKGLPEDFPAPTHLRRKERSNLLPSDLHQTRALFHHPPGMLRHT